MYKLYANNIYKECMYIRMNAYTYFKNTYVWVGGRTSAGQNSFDDLK